MAIDYLKDIDKYDEASAVEVILVFIKYLDPLTLKKIQDMLNYK